MTDPKPAPAVDPVEEQAYLGLLASLQSPEPPPHELQLVARIASYFRSPKVLTLIAERRAWYGTWEIREALLSNAATPEAVRDPLGTGVAILDLLRELDDPALTREEKRDIRDDIRSLIQGLPELDREIVETRVRRLVAKKPARDEAAAPVAAPAPAPPSALEPAPVALEAGDVMARVARFLTAGAAGLPAGDYRALYEAIEEAPDELRQRARAAFGERWSEFIRGVLDAVAVDEREPEAAPRAEVPEAEARVVPGMPPVLVPPKPAADEAAVAAAPATEALEPAVEPVPANMEAEVAQAAEAAALAESEAMAAAELAEAAAAVLVEPAPAEPAAAEPAEAVALETAEEVQAAEPAEAETPAESAEAAPAEAISSEEVQRLAFHPDDRVFASFLESPAASEEQVMSLAAKVSRERVQLINQHRRWASRPGIRQAMLQNPHTPEDVALACLDHVGALTGLMRVLHDPRVRSINVKAKAKSRLAERYKAMSIDERAASIRTSGGQLLNDLQTEVFNDRQVLLKVIAERGCEEGIVVKIARSRVAPREVLAAIGRNPAFLNHYTVCLELALNPKTPRDLLTRIIPKLNPQDRARLRQAGGVAAYARDLARK